MNSRPILFSAPMVRALLNGSKTQTRRAVKAQFAADAEPCEMGLTNDQGHQISGHSGLWWDDCESNHENAVRCPYGQPGDRLWVRETWCGEIDGHTSQLIYNEDGNTYKCLYRADGQHVVLDDGDGFTKTNKDGSEASPWKPSIHMPRWASRITLEITGVRIERLHAISEDDCWAEGIEQVMHVFDDASQCAMAKRIGASIEDAKPLYAQLWESINGPGSWDLNPWVWVVSFSRVAP